MFNEEMIADGITKNFQDNLEGELMVQFAEVDNDGRVYASWVNVYKMATEIYDDFSFSRDGIIKDDFGNYYVVTTVKADGKTRKQPYPITEIRPTGQGINKDFARSFVKNTAELTGIGFELWTKPNEIKQLVLNAQNKSVKNNAQSIRKTYSYQEQVNAYKHAVKTNICELYVLIGAVGRPEDVNSDMIVYKVDSYKAEISADNELSLYQKMSEMTSGLIESLRNDNAEEKVNGNVTDQELVNNVSNDDVALDQEYIANVKCAI